MQHESSYPRNPHFCPERGEMLFSLMGLAAGIILADRSADMHLENGDELSSELSVAVATELMQNLLDMGAVYWDDENFRKLIYMTVREYKDGVEFLLRGQHIPWLKEVPDLVAMDDRDIDKLLGMGE